MRNRGLEVIQVSKSTRFLLAALIGVAGAAALSAFPGFFVDSPYLPAWSVALLSLVLVGVGPALLAQAIIFLATGFFVVQPSGSILALSSAEAARLGIRLAFLVVADLFVWRLERERRASVQRERDLRESETRYRHILEQASDGIVIGSPDGRLLLANQRFCDMLGYRQDELLRIPIASLYAEGELERSPLGWDEPERTSVVLRERQLKRKDGSSFLAELSVRRTADGYAQAIVRDISERRRAEEALRSEHALLESILATSVAGIMVVTREGRIAFLNPAAEAAMGMTRDQLADLPGLPPGWRVLSLTGEPLPQAERPVWRVVATGEPITDARLIVEPPTGSRRILSVNAAPLLDAAGQVGSVVLSISDITEQQLAQQVIARSEEQLQHVTAAVPGVVYQYVVGPGPDCRFTFMSERAFELFGVRAEEILSDPSRWWAMVEPEDREPATRAFRDAVPREPRSLDFRVRGPSGQVRWLRDIATAVPAREPGRMIWNGVKIDITDRKRLEEELLQSQKMDSLGRLAGGVAHDFNNLLTVVRGYADVLSGELSDEDPRLAEVREIRRAADRATSLTRQLLAMSRRQVLVPRAVDLNVLVQEMERMLRRVIGEDIRIVTEPGRDLGWVRTDPGQLEQVLLNLAVNARDAMPAGGALTIATSRVVLKAGAEEPGTRGVPPGDYVVLRVADTGVGMDRETQGKIFEPFFTTKPVGEGTGLGLSTVYGIVQQSNGAVTVESEPGKGSVFRIFLPRMTEPVKPAGEATSPLPATPAVSRRATILLVEDDDSVRQLTFRVLEQYGYGVLLAADGGSALALLADERQVVDAVVSDVVMPGLSGAELIGQLRGRWPELPVLYLSGYTGDEVKGELRAGSREAFLQKPFSPDALATALEELLADTKPPATAG